MHHHLTTAQEEAHENCAEMWNTIAEYAAQGKIMSKRAAIVSLAIKLKEDKAIRIFSTDYGRTVLFDCFACEIYNKIHSCAGCPFITAYAERPHACAFAYQSPYRKWTYLEAHSLAKGFLTDQQMKSVQKYAIEIADLFI